VPAGSCATIHPDGTPCVGTDTCLGGQRSQSGTSTNDPPMRSYRRGARSRRVIGRSARSWVSCSIDGATGFCEAQGFVSATRRRSASAEKEEKPRNIPQHHPGHRHRRGRRDRRRTWQCPRNALRVAIRPAIGVARFSLKLEQAGAPDAP
jgi:hypothetical protein